MKKELRKKLLKLRKSQTDLDVINKSKSIINSLISSSLLENISSVHLYFPINKEVETKELIKYLWQKKIKVLLPRTDFDNRDLVNYEITDFSQLEKTTFNMLEPKTDNTVFTGNPDIVLVPGVGFDSELNRMGYGGGFYDRFLNSANTKKIALAFECQLVPNLPVEDHDIKMDMIITEDRIIK